MEETMAKTDDLTSTFQEAARIAEAVPEQFREAAFQRALDALLAPQPAARQQNAPNGSRDTGTISVNSPERGDAEKDLDRLLREIDSSGHPEIHDATNLRDQCLMVLRVIKNEYHVDGLTTSEVEMLLTSKFRVRASERGVRRALADAGRLVDRVPEGRGFRYRIMAAGEQHVTSLASAALQGQPATRGGMTANQRARRRTTRSAPTAGAVNNAVSSAASTESTTTRKRRDSTAKGVGPAARIRDLIASGWFSSPRTVNDILRELARRGAVYKRTDLTRLMINLVRSSELTRDQTADGKGRGVWHYAASPA